VSQAFADGVKRLSAALAGRRLDLSNEKATQREIGEALQTAGIDFQREHRLAPGDIVDFLLSDGIALEVKLRYSRREIERQIRRYAKHDAVRALVLATATAIHLPADIDGKPIHIISLGQAWL
jgi:hypothetical protein